MLADRNAADRMGERAEIQEEEIDHRLANVFQLVMATLDQQARYAPCQESRNAILIAVSQLQTWATIQRCMRSANEVGNVDYTQRMTMLCENLHGVLMERLGVAMEFSCEPLILSAPMWRDLAVIVNELIVNAAKHGFSEKHAERKLKISLRTDSAMLSCLVQNSSYTNRKCDSSPGRGSGTRLIANIVRNRGGSCTWLDDGTATKVLVELPLDAVRETSGPTADRIT